MNSRTTRLLAIGAITLMAVFSSPTAQAIAPSGLSSQANRVHQAAIPTNLHMYRSCNWLGVCKITYYEILNRQVISTNYTNYSQILGRCKVRTSGATCTVSTGTTATRTVQTSAGIGISNLSANLGISSAESVQYTVSCTSPKLTAGKSWVAHPTGTRYRYKVKSKGVTSGWLYAFVPRKNDINCGTS